MESLLTSPVFWVALGVMMIGLIIAISIIVSKRRAKEVEELDRMFPEGNLVGEGAEKISVEKVRRTTLEREKRKKARQHLSQTKVLPKKGQKALPDEGQEIILDKNADDVETDQDQAELTEEKRSSASVFGRSRQTSKSPSADEKELDDTISKMGETEDQDELAVRKVTKKTPKTETEETMDAATSRRLYKRSLLNPESLMGQEENEAESVKKEVEPPADQQDVEKQGQPFFKKRLGLTTRYSRQLKQEAAAQAEEEPVESPAPAELPSRSKRRPKKKFF